MANTSFYVPALRDAGAWQDVRNQFENGSYGVRALANIKYVAIHHTVTPSTGNAQRDLQSIANGHRGAIPYNIVITSENVNGYAKAFYTGELASIRAANPNRKGTYGIPAEYGNAYIVAVAIVGRFDGAHGNPTEEQLRTANLIAAELIYNEDQRFSGITNNWESLRAHKDFDYTACPGEIQNYRNAIINPPALPEAPQPEPPTRWQDTDFREEAHSFEVKHRVELKDFDTLEVKGVFVEGQEVEMQYVSNDNRWYASRWALENNKRHGVLIDDIAADQAVDSVAETVMVEEPQGVPQETREEEAVVDMPLETTVVLGPHEEPKTATQDAAKTIGKYLGPSGVATVATLTAWQQWLAQVPSYIWVLLFVLLNIFLIVLYNKSPKFNTTINRMVERVLKRVGIK